MSTADWVTLASTVFAAGAAGASWISVLQNRRERLAAESPAMTIDMIANDADQTVQVHLTNQGGAARGVEFAAAVGQRMVFGVPHRLRCSDRARAGSFRRRSRSVGRYS